MSKIDLPKRILEYAKKTNIQFVTTPRYSGWKKMGLPDLRGFCPHLRQVNLFKDKMEKSLWVLHDILHIAFYDFATLSLGQESWSIKERFLENHLASELFSVLLLDYHHLIHTKTKGLAVSLDAKSWVKFQKIIPTLPPVKSFEFGELLFNLYFTGESSVFVSQLGSKAFNEWLGHELRYSKKQRRYVLQWWEDLQGLKDSKEEAQIFGSQVFYGVWDLLEIFLSATDKEWAAYLKSVKQVENLFSGLAKYKKSFKSFNFCFTDIQSVSREEMSQILKNLKVPSSSGLFLMWQVLSSFAPERFDSRTKSDFKELSIVANNSQIDQSLWDQVKKVTQGALDGPHFNSTPTLPQTRGTFFLP